MRSSLLVTCGLAIGGGLLAWALDWSSGTYFLLAVLAAVAGGIVESRRMIADAPHRERQADLREALRTSKHMAEEANAPLIYLHYPDGEKPPYAVLIPDGPLLNAALNGMEAAGWNKYDHTHFAGDEWDDPH